MNKSVKKSRKSIRGGGLRKKSKSLRLKSRRQRQRGSRKSSKRKNRSKKRQRGGSAGTDTNTFIKIIGLLESLFNKINKGNFFLQNPISYPGKYQTLFSINNTIKRVAEVYQSIYGKELEHDKSKDIELNSILDVIGEMFQEVDISIGGGQALPSAFVKVENRILKLLDTFKNSRNPFSLQEILTLLEKLNTLELPKRMENYIKHTNTTYSANSKALLNGKNIPVRATPSNATTFNKVFI